LGITQEFLLSNLQVLKLSIGVDDEDDKSNKSIQKANNLAVQAPGSCMGRV
jgi:hypothetical protein